MSDIPDIFGEDYKAFLESEVPAKAAVLSKDKKAKKPAAVAAKPSNASTQMEDRVETKVDPNSLAPDEADKASPSHKKVAEIEARFLEVAGLTGDLTHFPIDKSNHLQVKTDKSKSDKHGEVFTPLWLVDQMIKRVAEAELEDQSRTYRDLCAGYGQFTVRLLRKKANLLGTRFNVQDFLGNYHSFVELQPNSCYRLLYIFGTGISLAIGDACLLGKLPDTAEGGIWVWCKADEVWKDMTTKVVKEFNDILSKGVENGIEKQAEQFEKWFNKLQERMQSRRDRG